MPIGGIDFDEDIKVQGGGGHCPFVVCLDYWEFLTPFIALGPALGVRDILTDRNRKQWGWGIISNFGITFNFYKYIHTNVEIANIYQVNKYDHVSNVILVPAFSFGLNF